METQKKTQAKAASPWTGAKERALAERTEKRDALLDAAAKTFGDRGFYGASLDDIAVRLGVSKPTLYYYTKSKDDLFEAVIERATERLMGITSAEPQASGLEQLMAFLRRCVEEVLSDDYGRCLAQVSRADLSGAATARLRENLRIIDRRLRTLLRKGIADGSIANCDVRLTGFMLSCALNGIPRWYDADGALSLGEVGEIMVKQLVNGLAPRT